LISFVRMGRPPIFEHPTFEIYVLEDDDEDEGQEQEQEQGVQMEQPEGGSASSLTGSRTPERVAIRSSHQVI